MLSFAGLMTTPIWRIPLAANPSIAWTIRGFAATVRSSLGRSPAMARTLVPKPAAGIMPLRTIVEDTITLHLYVTQHNFVGILPNLIHRFPLVSERKLFFEIQLQF